MMNAKTTNATRRPFWTSIRLLLLASPLFFAFPFQVQAFTSLTSGSGPGDPTPLTVPFDSLEGHYLVQHDLLFDPQAPPMVKDFQSPGPVIFPGTSFPVWEAWFLVEPGRPVSDWHEEILTPGWVWRFDPAVLITRNGQVIPAFPDPNSPPNILWVDFEPIFPGNVLDIHKELVWVGTIFNSDWGDFIDSSGSFLDESVIQVLEFPTPEPSSFLLAAMAAVGLIAYGWRRRRGE